MFAIYFPGKSGYGDQHLRDAGLEELLDGDAPQFADLQPGPDGGRGVVACWSKELFRGGDQVEWTRFQVSGIRHQAPDSRSLTPDAFFLGHARGRKPAPADFARSAQQLGSDVTLADGQAWQIPIARELPQLLRLTADGSRWQGTVAPTYQKFWDASWKTLDWFVPNEEGITRVSYEAGAEFIALALSVNYRINRVIASWLGLIRSDLFWSVAKVVTEFDELLGAKKNAADAGPGTNAGAAD